MRTVRLFLTTIVVVVAALTWVHASDPVAVYARVDSVVFGPSSDAPDTIQMWGVFSLAKPNDRNDYLPPARGYLYFKLLANQEVARKEWADLRAAAGSGQIVSFGSRYQLRTQLRQLDERPENPDPYVVSIGLTRIRGNTTYPPVRALIDYQDR